MLLEAFQGLSDLRYLSIEALPSVFEVAGMFEFFNVSKLHGNCDFDRELLKGNGSNATNVTALAFESASELAKEVERLPVTNRSLNPNFKVPPAARRVLQKFKCSS